MSDEKQMMAACPRYDEEKPRCYMCQHGGKHEMTQYCKNVSFGCPACTPLPAEESESKRREDALLARIAAGDTAYRERFVVWDAKRVELERALVAKEAECIAMDEDRKRLREEIESRRTSADGWWHKWEIQKLRAEAAEARVRELEHGAEISGHNLTKMSARMTEMEDIIQRQDKSLREMLEVNARLSGVTHFCAECESKAREIERIGQHAKRLERQISPSMADEAQERYRERLDRAIPIPPWDERTTHAQDVLHAAERIAAIDAHVAAKREEGKS